MFSLTQFKNSLASLTPDGKNEEQKLVHSIRSYVDSNFTDFALNLESVADYFGYNSKYVSRIFKAKTGMTFSKYLTSVRISHAVFLMGQGITSVKNVALLCGYSDPMYFSNVFKKKTGAMASEYIKSKNAVQQE